MNRTLFDKARALLFDSQLPKNMWGEAILTSAYLLNRSPTVTVDTTPAEKWYGKKPDLSRLQIFGTLCYAKVVGPKKKLDSRSKEAIFVGYSLNSYRLWDQEKRRLFCSRDVIFSKNRTLQRQETKNKETDEKLSVNFPQEANNKPDELDTDVQEDNEENEEENQAIENHEEIPRPTEHDPYLRPKRSVKTPKKFQDYEMLYSEEHAMITYNECLNGEDSEKWKEAIKAEKESLKKNDTWEIISKEEAKNKEILTSRWLFKVKDSGIYKARLVVRGCQQDTKKIDFKDTFSPVVESNSLRLMFAIAAKENLHIQTFDIKTAFLYGNLNEDIYMTLPEGFEKEGKICRLKKALYGLRQSPSQWNKVLTSYLKKEGLIQLKNDQCIFKDQNNQMYLAIHVDDGILMGKDRDKMKKLLTNLKKEFEMTTNENPSIYLGMEIKKNKEGIFISQKNYAEQVLKKYNMVESKAVSTPLTTASNSQEENEESDEKGKTKFPYRESVGSLLYMTNKTRPDMTYAVNFESRSMENPTRENVQNIKRTLRYLKGTTDLGILYSNEKTESETLVAYCDSDYAGDTKDRKSTSGCVLMYAGGPIAWNSRKQPIVALSTAEAEYISAAECVKEIKYIKSLFFELTNKNINTILNVDNQSAIKMIKSGQMSRKSKHIDVRYHYVSEQYQNGLFQIAYCNSENQLADIFTKILSGNKFQLFRNMLMKSS